MARSRNIKPGFFTSEQVAECTFAARLLFIGLWTLADREGRLEDRPRNIKMKLFPADNIDIPPLLDELERQNLIKRYHGKSCLGDNSEIPRYIQIDKFAKHQRPHPQEKPSELPAPDDLEDEPGKNTIDREKVVAKRSDILIPDTLNTDVPNADLRSDTHSRAGARDEDIGQVPDKPSRTVPPDWEPDVILPGQCRPQPGIDEEIELLNFRAHTFQSPKSRGQLQGEWIKWLNNAKPRARPLGTTGSMNDDAIRQFVEGDSDD